MSGMSGANHEVTPQSPLRPGPQTPHSHSTRPYGEVIWLETLRNWRRRRL
jgi:hypothetical protein